MSSPICAASAPVPVCVSAPVPVCVCVCTLSVPCTYTQEVVTSVFCLSDELLYLLLITNQWNIRDICSSHNNTIDFDSHGPGVRIFNVPCQQPVSRLQQSFGVMPTVLYFSICQLFCICVLCIYVFCICVEPTILYFSICCWISPYQSHTVVATNPGVLPSGEKTPLFSISVFVLHRVCIFVFSICLCLYLVCTSPVTWWSQPAAGSGQEVLARRVTLLKRQRAKRVSDQMTNWRMADSAISLERKGSKDKSWQTWLYKASLSFNL